MKEKVLIALALITYPTFGCVCDPPQVSIQAALRDYEMTQETFIGEVNWFNLDSTNFELEVCEVFKGSLRPGQVICGQNLEFCEPKVNSHGEWLLFGKLGVNFEVKSCGMSTDLHDPTMLEVLLNGSTFRNENERETLKNDFFQKVSAIIYHLRKKPVHNKV